MEPLKSMIFIFPKRMPLCLSYNIPISMSYTSQKRFIPQLGKSTHEYERYHVRTWCNTHFYAQPDYDPAGRFLPIKQFFLWLPPSNRFLYFNSHIDQRTEMEVYMNKINLQDLYPHTYKAIPTWESLTIC